MIFFAEGKNQRHQLRLEHGRIELTWARHALSGLYVDDPNSSGAMSIDQPLSDLKVVYRAVCDDLAIFSALADSTVAVIQDSRVGIIDHFG